VGGGGSLAVEKKCPGNAQEEKKGRKAAKMMLTLAASIVTRFVQSRGGKKWSNCQELQTDRTKEGA